MDQLENPVGINCSFTLSSSSRFLQELCKRLVRTFAGVPPQPTRGGTELSEVDIDLDKRDTFPSLKLFRCSSGVSTNKLRFRIEVGLKARLISFGSA